MRVWLILSVLLVQTPALCFIHNGNSAAGGNNKTIHITVSVWLIKTVMYGENGGKRLLCQWLFAEIMFSYNRKEVKRLKNNIFLI